MSGFILGENMFKLRLGGGGETNNTISGAWIFHGSPVIASLIHIIHSSPLSAEVKNGGDNSFTSPYVFVS
jgi:hypothetical protein